MTSFVYFIGCGEFVKIGVSTDPKRRIDDLLIGSPHELVLLACHPGTARDEAGLHQLLRKHHHRGEWFRSCDDLTAIIRNGLPHLSFTPMEFIRRDVFGLSQAEFALLAQVTQPTVSRWESGLGEPNRGDLARIRVHAKARKIVWDDAWFFGVPKGATAESAAA